MTDRSLLVQRPRVVAMRRADPATFSIGDEATVECGPSLLRLLMSTDPSGRPLSEGFALDWALPLGAGGSAVIVVSHPPPLEGLNLFTGVTCEATFHRPWKPTETLMGEARIESFGTSSMRVTFRALSADDGALVADGHYILVNTTPQGSRPFIRTPFPPLAQPAPVPVAPTPAAAPPPPAAAPSSDLLRRMYWTFLDWRNAGKRRPPHLRERLAYTLRDWQSERNRDTSKRSMKARLADAVLPASVAHRLRHWYWEQLEKKTVPQSQQTPVPTTAPPPPTVSSVPTRAAPPVPESEVESDRIDLFRLRSPVLLSSTSTANKVTAGDVWTWSFPNDLYQMLLNPAGGGSQPLARRLHPLSNIQIAMTAYIANTLTPSVPVKTAIHYMKTLQGKSDFHIRSEVISVDESTLVTEHVISEEGTAKTKVTLTTQRTHEATGTPIPKDVPSVRATSSEIIEAIDLEAKIARINPDYVNETILGGRYMSRLQGIHFSNSDRLLYLIYANAFVFVSNDDCKTLTEVREVNYRDGKLLPAESQSIDAIVDTMRRTVLLLGTDDRDGARHGTVWRKESGRTEFTRAIATGEPWPISKSGNAAAGYFGTEPREMVAVGMYAPGAQLFFSMDDGRTWRKQDLSTVFAEHVHEVYLSHSGTPGRAARLWVSGGDDPSGKGSGLVSYHGLDAKGDLSGFQVVLRERPGYRLVAVRGNGKHVFVGNESVAGGVLKILDNQEAIDASDFEYVLGKSRHDYHQFRSMVATIDGFLVSATDSYNFISDTVRADSGGYLYISNDEGASFREISLGAKWITSLTYDGRAFWTTVSGFRENGVDTSDNRLTVLRIPKPSNFVPLQDPYCVKAVIVDSSSFYEMAKYATHPRAKLEPGERTFRVDLSKYRSISISVDAWGPATLVVEALPFYNWSLAENRWVDVERLVLDRAGSRQVMLSEVAAQNRFFRVRNDGAKPAEFRSIAFIGKS